MIKRVVALVIMAMLFSFNCEKGCGMEKKDTEMKEQKADAPAMDDANQKMEGEKEGEMK